jgi:hypothetical protein
MLKLDDATLEKTIMLLRRLGKGSIIIDDPTEGICYAIKEELGPEAMIYVMQFIKDWTGHSGDDMFPVPCPFGGNAKLRYTRTSSLWHGEYGRLRKELALFLADKIDGVI